MAVLKVVVVRHRQIFDKRWTVGTGRARHYRCSCGWELKSKATKRIDVKEQTAAFDEQLGRHNRTFGSRVVVVGQGPVSLIG